MKHIQSARILIVEDEAAVAGLLATSLQIANFEVTIAQNAQQALRALELDPFDAVIVDWMMPGMTGLELIVQFRQQQKSQAIPVLMLTAKATEDDKIVGLNAGADDYLVKPFSPRELVARINALLRRAQPLRSVSHLVFGGLTLNPTDASVTYKSGNSSNFEAKVTLSSTEFKLLHCMMQQAQRLHTRDHLIAKVWGDGAAVDARTIDAHIKRLRQALLSAGCPPYIETLRGMGYKLSLGLDVALLKPEPNPTTS